MQRLVVVLLVLLFTGCSSIPPHQARNHREEGLRGGLLTGPDGEWVIKASPATAR